MKRRFPRVREGSDPLRSEHLLRVRRGDGSSHARLCFCLTQQIPRLIGIIACEATNSDQWRAHSDTTRVADKGW